LSFFDETDEPTIAPRTTTRRRRPPAGGGRRPPGGAGRRPPSDQQAIQIRRAVAAAAILIVLMAVLVILMIGGYIMNWTWTGFQGNTFWDWMKLLLLPIVLTVVTVRISQIQSSSAAKQS